MSELQREQITIDRRTVIITGASGGIGSALAKAYYEDGCRVVLADIDAEKGQETLRLISQRHDHEADDRLLFCLTDMRDSQSVEELIRTSEARFGSIDVMINNAGIGIWKNPLELSIDEWDTVISTNLRGTFIGSREAAAAMKRAGNSGAIINIASTRALMSEPGGEAYAASKGGIVALTHALAVSLGSDGITVNCISPGWIETGNYEMLREIDHKQHPSGRVGRVEDVVRACRYLTDPANDFVTGINLVVDGGMTRKMIYEPDN